MIIDHGGMTEKLSKGMLILTATTLLYYQVEKWICLVVIYDGYHWFSTHYEVMHMHNKIVTFKGGQLLW